ncbi:hypothetical protein HPB50_029370 [Hyalomma asiaticum]|nr:hypothetical protein HPB50_029370 [Hyalomma asiaticum]
MAAPNQVTSYDPESLQIVRMDTAQTETPPPTEEEYLKDMLRVWRGRKNPAVASRDARAPAAKQHAPSRPQQAQGKNVPRVTSQRAKQLQWRPKNTLRIEKDIIVVLTPRETLDLKATFGPGQDGAAVRCSPQHPRSRRKRGTCGVAPLVSKRACVHAQISGRRRETTLGLLSRAANYHSGDIRNSPPGRCTSCGVQVPATPDGPTEHQCIPSCLLCGGGHKTGAPGCSGRFQQPVKSGSPRGSKPKTTGGLKQAPTRKTGPKKAPTAKLNKPEPKKTRTGHSTNGTPLEPPVMVKDFQPLTPVQEQSPDPPLPKRPTAADRGARAPEPNSGCKIRELEAKQVGSAEPVQEAEANDGDDGSSITSRLTSVSRLDADKVNGPASFTGPIGCLESLQRKTKQLEARVTALPIEIISAVHESFQDMFTTGLTQALPEIVAQVSNLVLKALQPWVSTQIKISTQCDSPQLKRKPTSCQAAEGFSVLAPGGRCGFLQRPHWLQARSPAP